MEVHGYGGQPAPRQVMGAVPSMPVPPAASLDGGAAGFSMPAKGKQDGGVFFSPVISYDMLAKIPVMVFRDPETGEVSQQIPSERVVKSYRAREMKAPSPGETGEGAGVLLA